MKTLWVGIKVFFRHVEPYIRIGFIGFILVFLVSPIVYREPGLGLDQSWQMAINMAVEKGFVFGKDFIFTYGPLGYLCTRAPLGINKFTYLLFDIYLLINFGMVLNYVLSKFRAFTSYLLIFLVVSILNVYDPDNAVIFLSWIFLFSIFHFIYHQKKLMLINALLLSLMILFIKLNLGLIITFLLYLFFLFIWYCNKVTRKELLIYVLAHIISVAILCLVLNVNPLLYFKGSFEMIRGYLDAMYFPLSITDTEHPRNLVLIGLMAGFPFIWFVIKWKSIELDKYFGFLVLLVLILLYVIYKQSITRSAGIILFQFTPLFLGLLIVFKEPLYLKKLIPALIFSLLICYLALRPVSIVSLEKYNNKFENVLSYVRNMVDPDYIMNYEHLKEKRIMPQSLLDEIGTASVDIIPWEISYIKVNELNYNPRPVIQSYTAYTSYLDKMNHQKYRSPTAPEFVLFSEGSIDGRFTLFDETHTKLALLTNYEVVDNSWKYLLLKKLQLPIAYQVNKVEEGNHQLNNFLEIEDTDQLQLFQADIQYSLLGNIRKLLYQAPELLITFKFEKGRPATWRAVKPLLQAGVFINKYVDNHYSHELFITYNGQPSRRKIQSVKFYSPTAWAFKQDFSYRNQFISFPEENTKNKNFNQRTNFTLPKKSAKIRSYFNLKENFKFLKDQQPNIYVDYGWAHIKEMDAYGSKIYLVFQSKKDTLIFDTTPQLRPEVTAQSKNLNLHDAGFSFLIPKNVIPPGAYRLGFYIRNQKKEALTFMELIKVNEDKTLSQVGLEDLAILDFKNAYHYLDKLELKKDTIKIRGWAFKTGLKATGSIIKLRFRSRQDSKTFTLPTRVRSELSKFFSLHGVNYDSAGFKMAIPKNEFKPGTYRTSLIIENQGYREEIRLNKYIMEIPE